LLIGLVAFLLSRQCLQGEYGNGVRRRGKLWSQVDVRTCTNKYYVETGVGLFPRFPSMRNNKKKGGEREKRKKESEVKLSKALPILITVSTVKVPLNCLINASFIQHVSLIHLSSSFTHILSRNLHAT
jgi:hypothetical protein